MGKKQRTAINPTREENFPKWYQSVVEEADMAEMAHVRGCMVIKPWGFGIWENIQRILGQQIKDCGVRNAYFPLFVPLSYIEKEAKHVEGFAKEMAVVTHHRLENTEDGLVPTGKLTEPLIVRPTSETIIGESFANWIQSYRDLPLKINQWCNVVRWEMRPRVFLRTSEFLWQEGHTAFATAKEAYDDSIQMLKVYKDFVQDRLAIPVIDGVKPSYDKFPGALDTYCIEAMMQDGKALQAGTTHNLGTNFSKAVNITFTDSDGEQKYAHTASWGVSTRLIGGVIMTHADDNGLRLPPEIAPSQVVIIPIQRGKDEQEDAQVLEYAKKLKDSFKGLTFGKFSTPVIVELDDTLIKSSTKKWKWVKKGIPIQIEVGPRDVSENKFVARLRTEDSHEKHFLTIDQIESEILGFLEDIQKTYFDQAKERLQSSIKEVDTFDELKELFAKDYKGFVLAPWKPSDVEDNRLKKLQITIRCIPFEYKKEDKKCILTGEDTNIKAIFAKSY